MFTISTPDHGTITVTWESVNVYDAAPTTTHVRQAVDASGRLTRGQHIVAVTFAEGTVYNDTRYVRWIVHTHR